MPHALTPHGHSEFCANHKRISMIKALKDFKLYESFAYHISLFRQFVSTQTRHKGDFDGKDEGNISSVHGNNVWNSLKKKRGLDSSGHRGDDSSNKSTRSAAGGMRRIGSAQGRLSSLADERPTVRHAASTFL